MTNGATPLGSHPEKSPHQVAMIHGWVRKFESYLDLTRHIISDALSKFQPQVIHQAKLAYNIDQMAVYLVIVLMIDGRPVTTANRAIHKRDILNCKGEEDLQLLFVDNVEHLTLGCVKFLNDLFKKEEDVSDGQKPDTPEEAAPAEESAPADSAPSEDAAEGEAPAEESAG